MTSVFTIKGNILKQSDHYNELSGTYLLALALLLSVPFYAGGLYLLNNIHANLQEPEKLKEVQSSITLVVEKKLSPKVVKKVPATSAKKIPQSSKKKATRTSNKPQLVKNIKTNKLTEKKDDVMKKITNFSGKSTLDNALITDNLENNSALFQSYKADKNKSIHSTEKGSEVVFNPQTRHLVNKHSHSTLPTKKEEVYTYKTNSGQEIAVVGKSCFKLNEDPETGIVTWYIIRCKHLKSLSKKFVEDLQHANKK